MCKMWRLGRFMRFCKGCQKVFKWLQQLPFSRLLPGICDSGPNCLALDCGVSATKLLSLDSQTEQIACPLEQAPTVLSWPTLSCESEVGTLMDQTFMQRARFGSSLWQNSYVLLPLLMFGVNPRPRYLCTCVYAPTHIPTRMYERIVHMYLHRYALTCIHVYLHIHTWIHVHIHMYLYTDIHIYICIYMYTYRSAREGSNKQNTYITAYTHRYIYIYAYTHINIHVSIALMRLLPSTQC